VGGCCSQAGGWGLGVVADGQPVGTGSPKELGGLAYCWPGCRGGSAPNRKKKKLAQLSAPDLVADLCIEIRSVCGAGGRVVCVAAVVAIEEYAITILTPDF